MNDTASAERPVNPARPMVERKNTALANRLNKVAALLRRMANGTATSCDKAMASIYANELDKRHH